MDVGPLPKASGDDPSYDSWKILGIPIWRRKVVGLQSPYSSYSQRLRIRMGTVQPYPGFLPCAKLLRTGGRDK